MVATGFLFSRRDLLGLSKYYYLILVGLSLPRLLLAVHVYLPFVTYPDLIESKGRTIYTHPREGKIVPFSHTLFPPDL